MSNTDPERLGSLSNAPELTDALHAARERLPDARALEALRARIEAAAGGSAAPSAKRLPVALKIVLPLLGVAAVLASAQRLVPRAEAPISQVAPSVSRVTVPLPAAPPPNSMLPSTPPVATAPAPIVRPRAPPVAGAKPAAAAPDVSTELDLVKRAGQALKSDPVRALQLTMEHARLYPSGALSEEREVIAIEALAHLGRVSAAQSRAERFMAAYPRSAHLSRVERAAGLDAKNSDAGDQKN